MQRLLVLCSAASALRLAPRLAPPRLAKAPAVAAAPKAKRVAQVAAVAALAQGFADAALAGPLAEEPLHGVLFVLEVRDAASVNGADAVDLAAACRRACRVAFLTAEPRVVARQSESQFFRLVLFVAACSPR